MASTLLNLKLNSLLWSNLTFQQSWHTWWLSSSKHFLLLTPRPSQLLGFPLTSLVGHSFPDACCFIFSSWMRPGLRPYSACSSQLDSLPWKPHLVSCAHSSHVDVSGPRPWIPDPCSHSSLLCVYTSIITCLNADSGSGLQVCFPWSYLYQSRTTSFFQVQETSLTPPFPSHSTSKPSRNHETQVLLHFSPPHCYPSSLTHRCPLRGLLQLPCNWSPGFCPLLSWLREWLAWGCSVHRSGHVTSRLQTLSDSQFPLKAKVLL